MKARLNQQDYDEITILKNHCIENDQVTLKLELEYKLASANTNEFNEFMYYDDDLLIGYIGICQFGGSTLEVNGMVHPSYRRMGVFTKLFDLVKTESHYRNAENMLLLSDRNSPSGQAFIKQLETHYEHSEYEMHLKNAPDKQPPTTVKLRKATNADAKEIARQNAIYFEIDEPEVRLPEEEERHGVEIFLAEFEGTTIGKVHLETNEGVGAIYGLGVIPEQRGKGYGRAILMEAVKKLQEMQVEDIMLQVAVENKNALTLYKSCGFQVTSTMDYFTLEN
ncbi:GNAT family N-acetyltransferase [Thalassobacillus hwangdonensis]|uniref:GNAT family N-acetyltransferase n=2 Tax=Thalassobacillus hwangdonensis TaxID=546108 RepID=A0ABW3L107_9BACI